jgi:hypothetical protein
MSYIPADPTNVDVMVGSLGFNDEAYVITFSFEASSILKFFA